MQSGSHSNRMQRNFPLDTASQRFMEELYSRETGTRLKWHSKAKDRADEGPPTASRQSEVFRRRIEAACPRPTEALLQLRERYHPVSHHKRIRNFDDEFQIQPTMPESQLVDMIPPEPEIKDQLYDGISRDGKGRQMYLKSRNMPSPDTKYRLPVVSSWQYGWNLNEVVKKEDTKKPQFGRRKLVTDTFYSRNGITTLKVPAIN